MELPFQLSGSVLFTTDADCVPSIGSVVQIRTESYKKGLRAGTLISVPISGQDPPVFDYTEGAGVVVYIDLNGYTVLQEGPSPD
jgi:hypothetical protein